MTAIANKPSQVTEKKNFYCQNLCGEEDFDIEEWNKAFQFCLDAGLSEVEKSKILHPKGCKTQCNACINIVLDTQAKNKEKYGW